MAWTRTRSIIAVLILLSPALGGAADEQPMKLGFTVPSTWTSGPSEDGMTSFVTASGARVVVHGKGPAQETALKWATDELEALRHKYGKTPELGGGVTAEAFDVAGAPAEITVGDTVWATLTTDRAIRKGDRNAQLRVQQYFRKDGNQLIEVFVTDEIAKLQQLDRPALETFLNSIHVVAPQASVSDHFIRNAEELVYGNVKLGLVLRGPKGWAGLTQYEDQQGRPAYPLPPGVRQVFKKQYDDGEPPVPSIFLVSIAQQADGQTALDALKSGLAELPPETVLAQPSEALFGGRRWATMEFQEPVAARGTEILTKSKAYLTVHRGASIYLKGTANAAEYDQDRPIFDAVVAGATFSDNAAVDAVKGALERATTKARIGQ